MITMWKIRGAGAVILGTGVEDLVLVVVLLSVVVVAVFKKELLNFLNLLLWWKQIGAGAVRVRDGGAVTLGD